MKPIHRAFSSILIAFVIGAFAQTHPSQVWVPAGDQATPYRVRYVVYDLRHNRIQFRLEENNTDYFYFFNSSDEVQLMKAHAIQATLLTAKATGEGVYIYVVDGSTKSVNAVQLGTGARFPADPGRSGARPVFGTAFPAVPEMPPPGRKTTFVREAPMQVATMEFQELIPVQTAAALISAALPSYPAVRLSLSKCHGRILREPLRADREQPPFNRVAMDGVAVSTGAWEAGFRRFRVQGRQKAGEAPRRLASPMGAIEVMTGALLPEGTDCVIPVEELEVDGGDVVARNPDKGVRPYQNVHRAGSDCSAGDVIVPEGVTLTPARLGAAAAFGATTLAVAYAPSVAVLATGDELVDPAKEPSPHQVRRSNPYAVEAALRARRFDRVALLHSRDEPGRLRRAVEGLLGKCDVLILTGGVSMGKTDYVPGVLKDLGVAPVFHKVRQKPGKPLWFGVAPAGPGREARPVFALPGNPASVLVCLYRYVLPALREAMGGAPELPLRAVLEEPAPAPGTLTQFRPVSVRTMEGGALGAAFVSNQGSGDFSGWSRCDGFVELAAGESLPAGSAVPLFLW